MELELSQAAFLVFSGNNINSCASSTILHPLLLMMSKANKLSLETEPVSCGNNIVLTLK